MRLQHLLATGDLLMLSLLNSRFDAILFSQLILTNTNASAIASAQAQVLAYHLAAYLSLIATIIVALASTSGQRC